MASDPPNKNGNEQPPAKIRVHCFVDGFNLYHALDWFEKGKTEAENTKFRRYKWISHAELAKCFISSGSEEIVGVTLFTTIPTWDVGKQMRHRLFVRAQEACGVKVVFGAFRQKYVECKAICKNGFYVKIEKQTDVNIGITMVDLAYQDAYDKAILLSGDTDLIPAINLVRHRFPHKEVTAVLPIGRRANGLDMRRACSGEIKMNESHLQKSVMPEIVIDPKNNVRVQRPIEYLPV